MMLRQPSGNPASLKIEPQRSCVFGVSSLVRMTTVFQAASGPTIPLMARLMAAFQGAIVKHTPDRTISRALRARNTPTVRLPVAHIKRLICALRRWHISSHGRNYDACRGLDKVTRHTDEEVSEELVDVELRGVRLKEIASSLSGDLGSLEENISALVMRRLLPALEGCVGCRYSLTHVCIARRRYRVG